MATVRMQSWLSWQVITMVAVSGMLGASLGVVFTSLLAMKNMEALAQENYRREGRIQLLEFFVQQRTARDVASLTHSLDAAAHPAEAPSTASPSSTSGSRSAPVPPGPGGPRPSGTPAHQAKEPPRAPMEARSPQPPSATAVAAGAGKSAAAPPQAAPSAGPVAVAASGSPVTGEELIEARRNSKTEGVPAEKAGVRGLERDTVLLKNGNTVRVGGHFPSGEKLLQVDPENGLVVTNQRQLLLFFPAPASGQAPTTQPKGPS